MVPEKRTRPGQAREHNPNWKGGRSITSHGYVLIKMPEHPRAFSNGYVYEHWVIAEEKMGRALLPGEEVHHDDENKQNNHPDNLVIEPSRAHHLVHHRSSGSVRQLPGEPNTHVLCACGCGQTFPRFDTEKRPRAYISGHNFHEAPLRHAVEQAVLHGLTTPRAITEALGHGSHTSVRVVLSRLCHEGRIIRRAVGIYGPPGSTPLKEQVLRSCACGCGRCFQRYDRVGRERKFISGHNRRGHAKHER
jgi:HNH endonuclease